MAFFNKRAEAAAVRELVAALIWQAALTDAMYVLWECSQLAPLHLQTVAVMLATQPVFCVFCPLGALLANSSDLSKSISEAIVYPSTQ